MGVGDEDLKHYYENTGSASNPSYTRREGALNLFDGVADVGRSAPAFVDVDNDGDMDLVIGRGERVISSSTTRIQAARAILLTREERVRSTCLTGSPMWDPRVPRFCGCGR